MAQEALAEGRGFFRVNTRIGLKMYRVDRKRWEAESRTILEDRSEPDPTIDLELARWLDRIEQKLDRVLEQLANAAVVGNAHGKARDLVLSGSGIHFHEEASLFAGDSLLLELELPRTRVVRIRCLGTVVRVDASDEGSGVAVRFDVIREVDRDRIVEYTLEVQRGQLRGRRGSALT